MNESVFSSEADLRNTGLAFAASLLISSTGQARGGSSTSGEGVLDQPEKDGITSPLKSRFRDRPGACASTCVGERRNILPSGPGVYGIMYFRVTGVRGRLNSRSRLLPLESGLFPRRKGGGEAAACVRVVIFCFWWCGSLFWWHRVVVGAGVAGLLLLLEMKDQRSTGVCFSILAVAAGVTLLSVLL